MDKKRTTVSKPRQREGIFAYLDFLGTESFFREGKADEMLLDLIDLYNVAISQMNSNFGLIGEKPFTKVFSDNIAVGFHLNKNDTGETIMIKISELLAFIGYFQGSALKKGYLLRGGITCGYYYANETIVWGDALIKTVKMEEEQAVYPRVLVSDSLIMMINKQQSFFKIGLLSEDSKDGKKFVDYLWMINDDNERKELIDYYIRKRKESDDKSVIKKYDWIIEYLKCKENNCTNYSVESYEGE